MIAALLSLVVILTPSVAARDDIFSTEHLEEAVQSSSKLLTLYREYMATHGHTRPSCEQKKYRLELFLNEIKGVLALRQDASVAWTPGINFMADMTEEERSQMRGTVGNSSNSNLEQDNLKFSRVNVPQEFDGWRKAGLVGPIHDQKKGTCWAHATVAVLESQLAFYTNQFKQLSIQELHDCVYKDGKDFSGVYGGRCGDAFEYLGKAKRLGLNADNPETHMLDPRNLETFHKQQCKKAYKTQNALDGYDITIYGSVMWEGDLLEKVVCSGPVDVAIDSKHSNLDRYKDGLFSAQNCKKHDHAVTVVGYSKSAYIIRNSWGKKWGQDGYMTFDRSGPACCMFEDAHYAKLQPINNQNINECKLDKFTYY